VSGLLLLRLPAVSFLSRFLLKQGVLASPWWQRVLAVAPVILLLWLGVHWALGRADMDAAISLDNLTVSYRRHPALHHVNGAFARGSLTAIVGPNGAGKSTLLKTMLGLVRCNDGACIPMWMRAASPTCRSRPRLTAASPSR
jgi:ABC-type multidrug transport system fused ATPase/permease subunit